METNGIRDRRERVGDDGRRPPADDAEGIAHDAGIVHADEEVADGAATAGRAQAVPVTGASPDAGSQ